MAQNSKKKSLSEEVDTAKIELLRIRFRRVLGESVSAHVIKNARKNIAKCVRSLENGDKKNV
ncbi:MAG: 50S ribosomal protein L29 [Holosporaceae bacterium]|jgi:ribosomal protein L29|nr:50S ribosomal protein L29 [Holosporaceae bacterium]